MNGRSNSVGCLGLFAVLCLILMTAANIGALKWLDPNWVDQRAWWKPASATDDAPFKGSADPFVGTWNGRLFLAEGNFVEPFVRKMKEQAEKEMDQARGQIARMPADQQAQAQKQLEQMTKAVVVAEKAMRGAGHFARVGVPVQIAISSTWNGHEMQVRKIVGKDVSAEKNARFVLQRGDIRTALVSPQPGLPPLSLHLHRPGEIRDEQEVRYTAPDGSSQSFTVRWALYRKPAPITP